MNKKHPIMAAIILFVIALGMSSITTTIYAQPASQYGSSAGRCSAIQGGNLVEESHSPDTQQQRNVGQHIRTETPATEPCSQEALDNTGHQPSRRPAGDPEPPTHPNNGPPSFAQND
jgi:hypothetical protein